MPSPGAPATSRPADPCLMVIYGASGDLTQRKLVPALLNLARERLLPEAFAVVGVARSPMTHEAFREAMTEALPPPKGPEDAAISSRLVERLYYLPGDVSKPETYERLHELLRELEAAHRTRGNVFHYLATDPRFFSTVVSHLGRTGLAAQGGRWRRVIFEKPFGHDLESARALNRQIRQVLDEDQIYRIDHYLGKETVQNILVFRFSNGIFEPTWNRRYIDHVQITVAESIGVGGRGAYYDRAGALRDMVPNHIFQLLTLTAMEPPISFDADAVRDEQTKVLEAIQPLCGDDVPGCAVRGQYGAGSVDGAAVPAYRNEKNVPEDSTTETFAALRLFIDNWRWAGVPFYLRTGKRLPRRVTEIAIEFKGAPFVLFRQTDVASLQPNRLILHVQPEEKISLAFGAKVPGPTVRLGTVDMDFDYKEHFGEKPATGYERLLYDCMLGDATLFQRADMTEASWSVVEPILEAWSDSKPRGFPNYPAGSWGPEEARELVARDGREWRAC